MKARDLLQGAVKTLPAIATLRDAACFFRREKTRGVQVLGEQGRAGGVFSYDDLVDALASGAALSEQIGRFVRPMMCSVHQDTDISELRRYGSARRTRRNTRRSGNCRRRCSWWTPSGGCAGSMPPRPSFAPGTAGRRSTSP